MFIPYSTDAPIYHLPIATVGLIIVNIGIFFAAVTGQLSNPEQWIMPYGQGLTPLTWLLSMFMHADLGHVLGNMLFLWIFGLVVEGKIGWWRFLLCYIGIGMVQSVGEQTLQLLLGGEGGSLGASSAIYGIMAMAAIWAPKNCVQVFYWIFFYLTGTVDVPILAFAAFYIGSDLFFSFFEGFNSTSWLHVGGAMLGAPLAIVMLKRKMVDCEGWDIFHVQRGETGNTKQAIDDAELAKRQEKHNAHMREEGQAKVQFLLDADNCQAALALTLKLQHISSDFKLSRSQLLEMITALHREKRWKDSCPLMAEVIKRFPKESQAVQVKLAQICVVELQKPGKAVELLKSLDLQQLSPKTLSLVKKIAHRAKQMQAEGVVELDDDQW